MKHIKPCSDLPGVFCNKVRGKEVLTFLIFAKRKMTFTKRGAPSLDPRIKHFGNSLYFLVSASFTRTIYLIYFWFMQICYFLMRLFFKFLYGTRHVSKSTLLTIPHRDRRSPISVARYIPIRRILKAIKKPPVLKMLWKPIDLFVGLFHKRLKFLHIYKPRIQRCIIQPCLAPPT